MVKYEYNPNIEGFKRVDNRGRTLDLNIVEARRIVALKNLGYTVTDIYHEMELARKITITTLRTFIRNFENGNITVEGDFPIPQKNLDEMDNEIRLTKIEERLDALEQRNVSCECECESHSESKIEKVKKWFS